MIFYFSLGCSLLRCATIFFWMDSESWTRNSVAAALGLLKRPEGRLTHLDCVGQMYCYRSIAICCSLEVWSSLNYQLSEHENPRITAAGWWARERQPSYLCALVKRGLPLPQEFWSSLGTGSYYRDWFTDACPAGFSVFCCQASTVFLVLPIC